MQYSMRIGVHIRTAEGLIKALDTARDLPCIIETPVGDDPAWDIKNLTTLRALRAGKQTL